MFCSHCGAEIKEGEKFCPNCGTPVGAGSDIKGFVFNENEVAGQESMDRGPEANANGSAEAGFNAGTGSTNNAGGDQYFHSAPYGSIPRKADREFWVYLLLTWVTCGIYNLVFMYELIRDVNIACEGDGETTPGLVQLILLSIVTCGIYSFIWHYKLGNRLANNCKRYGYTVTEDGVTVLLWMIFSSWICGIGTYVAKYIIITQTNKVCAGYNVSNGLA